MALTDWAEALHYLSCAARFGREPGLHRIRALLDILGHPQRAIPRIVHIGGTNGKGSVTFYISSILSAAGFRVGRFTSPHLLNPCERMVIDGQPIPPERFSHLLLNVIRPAAGRVAAALGEHPTFFELLTAAMYVWCQEQKVDWLVQEVGLGGRFDATNVIPAPQLSIITNVDLDHNNRLGNTIEAIAADKAHIIKPGGMALTAAAGPALEEIRRRAAEVDARLYTLSPGDGAGSDYIYSVLSATLTGSRFKLATAGGREYTFTTNALGLYQAANAAISVAAVDLLSANGLIPPQAVIQRAIERGLNTMRWPGRMDLFPGRPPVLVDGAHNRAAMHSLCRSIEWLFPRRPVVLVVALSGDRDPKEVFQSWFEYSAPVLGWAVVPLNPERAGAMANLAAQLAGLGARPVQVFDSVGAGLNWARQQALAARASSTRLSPVTADPGLVVVCGSLYLAGAVLPLVSPVSPAAANPVGPAH